MKVIAINGSPKQNGNTTAALGFMIERLEKENIETELIHVGHKPIHGCIGCGHCSQSENNLCVFKDDLVNETALKMRAADGIILGSPTYYSAIAGTMKCFLDRAFYTSSSYFSHKVGSAVAVTRRAGAVDTYHQLLNYLTLSEMVVAPTFYWNIAYGTVPNEVPNDAEGVQTLQQSAANMAWLIKALKESKTPPPERPEKRHRTNFIR